MKVEMYEIDSVIPYHKNPRNNTKAIPKVEKSLKKFGFRQPIVVDKNMIVIVGHTRLQAARNLGIKRVPVHIASDMSAKQAAAYRLMDNRTSEFAEWDDPLLVSEIDSITFDDNEWSIEELGFENYDFDVNAEEGKPKDRKSPTYKTIFEVVVECESEKDQQLMYENLTKKGHKCRVLSM